MSSNPGPVRLVSVAATVALSVALAMSVGRPAEAHPERATTFPHQRSSVPAYRETGTAHVVCAPDSPARVEAARPGDARLRNLDLLDHCRFGSIQAAVDAASSGDRVLILPGTYEESASRSIPVDDPRCRHLYETTTHGDARDPGPERYRVASYEYQFWCPNSRNLIAIVGDSLSDADRVCDRKCDLQIEGTGEAPEDVVIRADQLKKDVIHADRADGLYLRNLTVEAGAFNGINVIETNGYVLDRVVARHNQNYGVLTFTTTNGLYDHVTTHNNGHAGVYPGSTMKASCDGHSIEMRHVESFGNTYGYSGTGGNSVWVHDSSFHHNVTGISTDSTASAHPGMPQECARFEDNEIYSNNLDLFSAERWAQCRTSFAERDPSLACPYYVAPIGTGIQILGGNRNLIRNNHIYDNWRAGIRLHSVPAAVRSDENPWNQFDTSHWNQFVNNVMGGRPDGTHAPNGTDFYWDEGGVGNCWSANEGHQGSAVTSDPMFLPGCPNMAPFLPPNPLKTAVEVPCARYDPQTNRAPGCDWMKPPTRPATRT